jgi:hypothetical protein
MSFDLQRIIESKGALRRNLAAPPVGEKLRMLDALPERELAIRGRAVHSDSSSLREKPAPYLSGRVLRPLLPGAIGLPRLRASLWNAGFLLATFCF